MSTYYQLPNIVTTYSCGCTVTCSLSRFVHIARQTSKTKVMLLPNKKMKFWKNGLGTVQLLSNYDKPTHFRVPKAAECLKHLTFSTGLQKLIYDPVGKSRICTLPQSSNENGRSKEKHTTCQTSGNGTSIQFTSVYPEVLKISHNITEEHIGKSFDEGAIFFRQCRGSTASRSLSPNSWR